jgi:putative tricarboxylic transport membrane protein
MKKTFFAALAVVFMLSVTFAAYSEGASYPSKPLEVVAPANPGGGWDAMARTINIALEKEKIYPQPISVLNKPGGGGAVGMAYIVGKKGDDYELIVYSPPLIIKTIDKTFPEPYTKLTPLAKLITDYQVFIVKADSPYKTLKDLLTDIKKNPGAVKFAGGSAPGSMDHLAFCKVAKAAGINPKDLVYVAFSGGGEALTTLLGGNVAFVSSGTGEVLSHIEAGTVRALAISSPKRATSGPLKNVPTVKEAGVNVTYEVWRGVFGAPEMSKDAQAYWATTIKKMVATQTWKDQLTKLSWLDAYADSKEFTKFLADEEKSYKELMLDLGFVK